MTTYTDDQLLALSRNDARALSGDLIRRRLQLMLRREDADMIRKIADSVLTDPDAADPKHAEIVGRARQVRDAADRLAAENFHEHAVGEYILKGRWQTEMGF